MDKGSPRPPPTQRPRTAGARLRPDRESCPDSVTPRLDRESAFLPHLQRRRPQPHPSQSQPQQQQQQQQQQPEQPQAPERSLGTDRNALTHTLGNQIQNNDLTSVGPLTPSLETPAGAHRADQSPGKIPEKPRVVEVVAERLEREDAYRFYFESNKHGGDVNDVKVDQQKHLVFVTFDKPEVAERVVQHKHMIGSQTLEVRLGDGSYQPPADYHPDKLLFRNVDATIHKEHLSNYFELVSGCEPDQILYGDTAGNVLVTFRHPTDVERTAVRCSGKPLAGRQVSVERVARSTSVIVENLSPHPSEDGIRNHFENPNKGGAPVERLRFSPDKRQCFVYFRTSEVAEQVAASPHRLEGRELRVKVYTECLGPSAGGFDPKDFYFPQPFTVQEVYPLVFQFLREANKVQRDWRKIFKSLHADVSFGKAEGDPVVVSCTLENTHPKFRLLAEKWKVEADSAVGRMVAAVGTGTVRVQPHSWKDAENHIKDKISLDTNAAILISVEADMTITVVGLTTQLVKNLQKVRKAVANIEKNNMKRKTETVKLESYEMKLLDQRNFFKDKTKNFKELTIDPNAEKRTILFDGTIVDIRDAVLEMKKLLQTVKCRQLTELSDIQRDLLDSEHTVKAVKASLGEKHVDAVWEKARKEVNIYAFGEEVVKATEKAISRQVCVEIYSISDESTQLLDTPKFKQTLQQLIDEYPGRLRIEPKPAEKKIVIAGGFVRNTRKQIETYLLENTIYSETVRFSSSRQQIIRTEWKDKLTVIQTELQVHMVEISCGENDQAIKVTGNSQGLREARRKLQQLGTQILCHTIPLTQPEQTQFLRSKKCKKDRDQIVRSNNCVISLQCEPDELQVVKSTRPPSPKPETEAVTEDEEETDRENDDDPSYAPPDDASPTDISQGKAAPKQKLGQHMGPGETSEDPDPDPDPDPHPPAKEPEPQKTRPPVHDRIHVMKADVTGTDVDVIVNAANERLDHAGGLAKVIVDKGGRGIQEESESIVRQMGKDLEEGEVVATGPGNLPCTAIFHAVGPRYRDGRQGERDRLALAVTNCLQLACDRGYRTIAIPALSTGIFKYPVEEASLVLVKAAKEFLESQPDCSLHTVLFCDTCEDKVRHLLSAKRTLLPSAGHHAGIPPVPPAPETGATSPHSPGITLSLVRGEIAKQQADAIVNTISQEGKLNQGKVSNSILREAGPELQTEMQTSYPKPLQYGQVAVTTGCKLQCRHVLHVCLSRWAGPTSVQMLQQVMTTCLSEAAHRGCTSIAFPALGMGNLQYPEDIAAQTMVQAVGTFEQSHPTTPITEVRMVIHPNDHKIFQAFEQAKQQGSALPAVPVPVVPGDPPASPLNLASPLHGTDVSTKYGHSPAFAEQPGSEMEYREIKECELLGVRIIVKQGWEESESADAIIVYSDLHHLQSGNYENMEEIKPNAREHTSNLKQYFIDCLQVAAHNMYRTIVMESPPAEKGRMDTERFAQDVFAAVTQTQPMELQEMNVVFKDPKDIHIFMLTLEKHGDRYNNANPVHEDGKEHADTLFLTKKHFEMCDRTTAKSDILYIYTTKDRNIRQFCEDFEAYVRENFPTETWKEELMKKNEQFIKGIQQVAKNKRVQMSVDREAGTIAVSGFRKDVNQTVMDVKEIFRKAKDDEQEEKMKAIYDKYAQWGRLLEEKGKGTECEKYSKEKNSEIEKAFQEENKTVTIYHRDQTYVIDFEDMVEYPTANQDNKVLVLRRVNVQDKHEVQIPETWEVHSLKELPKFVPLQPTSPEFVTVADNFMATIGERQMTIVEITRIQNQVLYQQYQLKKMQMETQNHAVADVCNERLLWHGTAKDATDNINNHGFNRSYCGKNATVHGQGVYFAKTSHYSARELYSPKDEDGKRYMYQSKILVGVSCLGDQNMRVLPARDGNVMYDSACDDVSEPGIYVIFLDMQAYPEYLITFKNA